MKQPVAAGVIEFPSKLTMANTSNILAAFAIAFLASLSLSSAFVKHDLDIPSASIENHFDHELQSFLREKRQKEAEVVYLKNNNDLELEEGLSESKSVHDRRAVEEEAKETGQKDDEKDKEPKKSSTPKTSNDIEEDEDAQGDVFSYRSMHDLIQALILADEEDIAERLQELREAKNATKSKTASNLPKREAVASAAAAAAASASSGLLGANLWDVVPLADLDDHSCEVEAFSHGHLHVSGTIVHEFFCEQRKLWHYALITLRNLKSELTLGPLIAGDVVTDGIFGHLLHHTSHLLHAVIREPHHLLILPDIIRDAVPFPSIIGAIHRLKQVFLRVQHFSLDLFRGHVYHVLGHLFSHHHLGVHLREKLHHLRRFGSILPLEEIAAGPIVSTAASAATATATATATTTASSDGSIIVPDYHRSLAEVLSSFRGFYDGYHASGVPHLIRTAANSFSTSSAFSKVGSYLSRLPFFNYCRYGPVEQDTTVIASSASSASSSVGIGNSVVSPIVGPVVGPVISPVVPLETASSSASATATATATVAETSHPVVTAGPAIVPSVLPYESTSSNAAAAAAATAAAATSAATAAAATAASPVVSGYRTVPRVYAPAVTPLSTTSTVSASNTISTSNTVVEEAAVPLIQPVPTLSPAIVSSVPAVVAASAAASSAVSSARNVVPAPLVGRSRVPHTLSLRGHRPRPILSTVAPAAAAAAAAAAASASASTGGTLLEPTRYGGLDLDIDRRIRYPLTRSRVFPAVVPSSAAASSVATSSAATSSAATSSAATSSAAAASAVSSGGFNLVLPREQIVGALGNDYLLPDDVIAVTLRNKSILFGRVLDATSPITFSFLKPKLRASLLRHGGRVWKLLPRDFRDPECIRKFNNPLLLRDSL